MKLATLEPQDAVKFMKLQGINKGSDTEIMEACKVYGFHPLSLKLLSSYIARDHSNSGDITNAPKYSDAEDMIARRNHILDKSYSSLRPDLGNLLSKLSAFRGSVTYQTLTVLNNYTNEIEFSDALNELITRGFLSVEQNTGSYDLHPIVRAYAYDQLSNPSSTHKNLRNYFASIPDNIPSQLISKDDLWATIELYYHTAKSKAYEEAWTLYNSRLRHFMYYQFGAYQEDIYLLKELLNPINNSPYLSDHTSGAWFFIYMSMNYERIGQLEQALDCSEQGILLGEKSISIVDKGVATLTKASVSNHMGNLKRSNEYSEKAIDILEKTGEPNWIGISHRNYARLLITLGRFIDARNELKIAHSAYQSGNADFTHGYSVIWIYVSRLEEQLGNLEAAKEAAEKAYNLAHQGQLVREKVGATIKLTEILIQKDELQRAEFLLEKALVSCHRMNLVELEPQILLNMAKLCFKDFNNSQEKKEEAYQLALKAMSIAERHLYKLRQADIHNFLSEWFISSNDSEKAHFHASKAKGYSLSDEDRNFTYYSGLKKAEFLLNELSVP